MSDKGRHTHTLCWNCAHSVHPDVCPWVDDFTPVPGWTAVKTSLMQDSVQPYESYRVVSCPLFKRDAYRGGTRKKVRP